MNSTTDATCGSHLDVNLIDLGFFQGNLDYFVDFYNVTNKKLQADGYSGYFDSALFSPEWWDCISYFFLFGFTYEAILYIEKLENHTLLSREMKRELGRIKNREQLCKNAREYLTEFTYGTFLKIKSEHPNIVRGMVHDYLDPKIAKFPAAGTFVNAYWHIHMNAFISTFNKAKNGIADDTGSVIASKEAMQIISLVKMIAEKGNPKLTSENPTQNNNGKIKEVINKFNKQVVDLTDERDSLLKENAKHVKDYNTLVDEHTTVIDGYNQLVDDNLGLEEQISDLNKEKEKLIESLSIIPRLELIIRLQSSLITFNQDLDIQSLFQIENIDFQNRFRGILKKYISDIHTSIGPHLSSTTSHATTGSGTFAFHVLGTLFNHIGKNLENMHWNGLMNIKNHLHIPQNGDTSKGGIYDFFELTKNLNPMGFIEFFQWLGTQKMVGQSNFGTVFDAIGGKVKEKTPALQREIRDFINKYIIELQKQK